jgi:membrane protein implicated in regulation of membrane protease activity
MTPVGSSVRVSHDRYCLDQEPATCQSRIRPTGVCAVDATAVAFLAIGVLGLVVLVVSLFVGEIGELGLGEADADGTFSVPAIAALLGGIGFGGAAATALLPVGGAAGVLLALAAGLAVAVPLAWGAIRLTRGLQHMPTQETLTRQHLLGAQGVVVSAVPAGGLGEIRLVLGGQPLKLSARSDRPLVAGTPVYVTDTVSETCVEVVSTAPDPLPDVPPEPGGHRP